MAPENGLSTATALWYKRSTHRIRQPFASINRSNPLIRKLILQRQWVTLKLKSKTCGDRVEAALASNVTVQHVIPDDDRARALEALFIRQGERKRRMCGSRGSRSGAREEGRDISVDVYLRYGLCSRHY